jgi:[ribosomal protein S5]-alanine N-acetyltransferase
LTGRTVIVSTPRLDLVAATLEHMVAEADDPERLGTILGASVPKDWPPPLNDEDSQRFFMDGLRERPGAVGWLMWYFVRREEPRTVVGNGGFKGEPADGTVELGYSIIPAFQRRGFASEAADALVRWAFRESRVQRVVAETFPDLEGSLGVLRKTGFVRCEGALEPGAVRFERKRP